MNPLFNLSETPIDPGITLIEASAGTGKTYAIAGTVVRLVAEKNFPIGEILVVTFTEAATAELRDRIRKRLREAMLLLQAGRAAEDDALASFTKSGDTETGAAIKRLKTALLSFDEAAVFTIHGFCQRMLRENAFETGSLFDVELSADAEPIWRETAEDFWRKRFYHVPDDAGAMIVALQETGDLSTDSLIGLLQKISRHPELRIVPESSGDTAGQCEAELPRLCERLRNEWRQSADEILELLRNQKCLSRNKKDGLPPGRIEELAETLQPLAGATPITPSTVRALLSLAGKNLPVKPSAKTVPEHPFFDLCDELDELLASYARSIRRAFIDYVRAELPEVKKRKNLLTFDDLLNRLYETLEGPGGGELRTGIGKRYQAALIDEFQDTDPVQWKIFDRIFGGGEHILFLIGDPKQAIYAFRGADIFTYLEARDKARRRYTLGQNHRSDKLLVEAANSLFTQTGNPFVFPGIGFQPVEPARDSAAGLDLDNSGLDPRPLQLVCIHDEDEGKLRVSDAKERILDRMVTEIGHLLDGKVRRGEAPLEPGDIAVLVRTNREAESVRQALVARGIPGIVRTDHSVLQTEEAEHLSRLLAAVIEPHKSGLIKAALASPLFGFDAPVIAAIDSNETEWQKLGEAFHAWRETWARHGFMRMFREFLYERRVRARVLALPDGERALTNYQHAAECLHQAEYEHSLTPAALYRRLREQIERPEGDSDNLVIRLEKDEKAVQIVTIHRSKGLQYPVVFCPFNWTSTPGTSNKGVRPDVIFHDPDNGNRLTWDLNDPPDQGHLTAFRQERIAEAVRLLYVAVTRACNRCYLFWAETSESIDNRYSAIARLFDCDDTKSPPPSVAFSQVSDGHGATLFQPPARRETRERSFADANPESLRARRFNRSLPAAPLITSFSALTANASEDLPDRDAAPSESERPEPEIENPPADEVSIFTFPKGARAGNFFHSLLEKLDFGDPENLAPLLDEQFRLFRMDPAFRDVVSKQIQILLRTPLSPVGPESEDSRARPIEGLELSRIPREDRLAESSFYFPVSPAGPDEIADVFGARSFPADFTRGLGRLDFRPADGYMTGFIDLVFRWKNKYFMIDWKSNWLGPNIDAYGPESIRRAMTTGYYFLQYHLYALALDRHLVRTLPGYRYEENFGGVYYIFLRGLDPANPESGVFYDRPEPELLERLRQTLGISIRRQSRRNMIHG